MAWHVECQPKISMFFACECELSSVNIACALRWGVASIGITLLGVAHPIRENISGAGYTSVDCSHPGLQG